MKTTAAARYFPGGEKYGDQEARRGAEAQVNSPARRSTHISTESMLSCRALAPINCEYQWALDLEMQLAEFAAMNLPLTEPAA